MNKIYRVIWNSTLGQWIVTSELGRGKIKGTTSKALSVIALTSFLISPSVSALTIDAGETVSVPETQSSPWETSNLIVGSTGSGTLLIEDEGKVISTGIAYIGQATGSIGVAEVSGTGSLWDNNKYLSIGHSGNGLLTINDGGIVKSHSGYIGTNGTGIVEVSGAGSEWNNWYGKISSTYSYIYVGYSGNGSLIISDGGALNHSQGSIGTNVGATGVALVTGIGSQWNNDSNLRIGEYGNGMLTITEGGTVTSAHTSIGLYTGSTGVVNVAGSGSHLDLQSIYTLTVGNAGDGTLTISEGGEITSRFGTIGSAAYSTGVVNVTGSGSLWTITYNSGNAFTVGNAGNGALTISEGGTVSNIRSSATIGKEAGSTGVVNVTDSESLWNSGDTLIVGNAGNGTLTISEGGTVITNKSASIGKEADSIGIVSVTGGESLWNIKYFSSNIVNNITNTLSVGESGNGALTISEGGTVINESASIGRNSGSTGMVNVTGSGSLWKIKFNSSQITSKNNSTLSVGESGNGLLTISEGGTVTNESASIGRYAGSTGVVNVTDDGSQWNTSKMLTVGNVGNGTLTITDKSEVSAKDVAMAVDPTSSGTLNIGNGSLAGILNTASITGGTGSAIVNFNHTDDIDFSPIMSGLLTVNQVNSGTTRLTAVSDYAGITTVNSGILQAGAVGAFSLHSDFVTVAGGALDLAGYNQTVASLNNGGIVNFNGAPGTVLTVSGNYIGNNGLLNFNTVLNDDASPSDKLVVAGNTSGETGVIVNNISGTGQPTVNGIEVISVGGLSDGNFTLRGRAVAGAYEYFLNKGGVATPDDGNWYLRSQIVPPTPPVLPPVDPVIPPVDPQVPPVEPRIPEVDPETPASTPNTTPAENIIRPEAGSYMANMAIAGKLFNLRLEDREGRAENSSIWLRQVGSRNKFRDTTGQSRTTTNSYLIQGGGEIGDTHFTDSDRLGVGLMAAYGNASSKTRSNRTGYHSEGNVDGYSAGVYATWYQDAASLNGLYVDSWMQYSWLNGEVKGDQLSGENYDISGLSASVETGYRIPVYQGLNSNVFITPQAQVIWSGITADDHQEVNGTHVTSSGDNNVQTRLGVKVSRDSVSDSSKEKQFTLYAEANWLNNTQQAGAALNGVKIKQSGSRNLAELKLGAEGQVNKHLNLWSNVAQQMGSNGYSDTSVMIGIKYRF